MGKKNPLLFTIQFTAGLPMHEQAAAFLGQCGRHKASIIAEALNMYLSQDRCQREPLRVPVPEPLSVPAPMPGLTGACPSTGYCKHRNGSAESGYA